jgi:multidrug efflux pump subunit AcrA (membrane-fusion protein)
MNVKTESESGPFPHQSGLRQAAAKTPPHSLPGIAAQPAASATIGADISVDAIAKQLMAMRGELRDAIGDETTQADANLPADELSRFNQTPPPGAATPVKQGDVDVAKLLIDIATAETRADAIKTLVTSLSKAHSGMTIRCGIGAKRMRRFYDPRLGWVGPESTLQRTLGSIWERVHDQSDTMLAADSPGQSDGNSPGAAPSKPSDARSQHPFVVTLARGDLLVPLWRPDPANGEGVPGGEMREVAVLWISDSDQAANVVKRWEPWIRIVAASVWSRPAGWLPVWIRQPGNRRAIFAAVATLVTLLSLFPTPYRVSASVRVQPVSPRIVSAPFEAMVEDVMVRPGDVVRAGQSLLKLDGRPLRLERQSLDAEISQSAKQKDIALAAGKVAESQQAQLKYQQLLRRRDLIDRRLDQLTVTSPISGVVVSGDLRQAIGASLELGKVLLEIAPLHRVLAEVAIPEYEISMIRPNRPARIRIDASGCPTIRRDLVEIYPAGELRDTEVVFISLLELDNKDRAYRPGMTGKATVYGDVRPFIWPYIRKGIDQLTWIVGL